MAVQVAPMVRTIMEVVAVQAALMVHTTMVGGAAQVVPMVRITMAAVVTDQVVPHSVGIVVPLNVRTIVRTNVQKIVIHIVGRVVEMDAMDLAYTIAREDVLMDVETVQLVPGAMLVHATVQAFVSKLVRVPAEDHAQMVQPLYL